MPSNPFGSFTMGTASARAPVSTTVAQYPERTSRARSICQSDLFGRISNLVIESGSERAAVDKNVPALRAGLIREIDLSLRPTPSILLIQPSCHLPGNPLEGTELSLHIM